MTMEIQRLKEEKMVAVAFTMSENEWVVFISQVRKGSVSLADQIHDKVFPPSDGGA